MTIREYLKNKKLICDGAFGTYYAAMGGSGLPEKANIDHPELVLMIHQAYIKAGARLIRTNTFASNTKTLSCDKETMSENMIAAYQLAMQATEIVDDTVYVAGDIGPLPDMRTLEEAKIYEEYRFICDTFIKAGAKILIFETMKGLDVIDRVIEDVKKENPDLFIIVQFCVNQHGYTETGMNAKRLLEKIASMQAIDVTGFNCGVGPGHMYQILTQLNLDIGKNMIALPNASYPKSIQDRLVFMENMDYFADKVKDIATLGVTILGGCCGTNPKYIEKILETVPLETDSENHSLVSSSSLILDTKKENHFFAHKKKNEKIIAVELSPPPNADFEKIMDSANLLKSSKVDVITFPDSPSGRTRADSILMAVKVANEVKIPVMPHICCRDKNAIAMRSQLLGAHINGVKNLLVITGDPVPVTVRQEIKSVFNFESVGVMRAIQEMNKEQFAQNEMIYGGALNHNRPNIEVEIERMRKKIAAGAQFFMTQPLFSKADVERLRYMKSQVDTRIICGVMPLVSKKNALFMKNEMAGIDIPDDIVANFKDGMTREEGEKVGVSIVKNIKELTEDFVDGYYFSIPFNRVYLLEQML